MPSRVTRIVAATALVAVNLVALAHAAPGDLDATFGTGGLVTSSVLPEVATSVAIQSDQHIVVAGGSQGGLFTDEMVLSRVNPDGTADTSFGGTGTVHVSLGAGEDKINAIAIQADDRIVAVGTTGNTGLPADDHDFAIVRFNPDGTLDSTFNGTGVITQSFGAGRDEALAVAIQPDGGILVVGSSAPAVSIPAGEPSAIALRFKANGTLDPTFASGGILNDNQFTGFSGVALQSGGRVLIAGGFKPMPSASLLRLQSDGTVDASFGVGGLVSLPTDVFHFGVVFAVQADDKIALAGTGTNGIPGVVNDSVGVGRLLPDGAFDPSFAGTGSVLLPNGGSHHSLAERRFFEQANAVVVQTDGKIVVGGRANTHGSEPLPPANGADMLLVRLRTDGTLDPTFGGRNAPRLGVRGKVTTSVGADESGRALALQADGRIVLAGFSNHGSFSAVLARYESGCASVACPIAQPTTDSDSDCECDAQDPCTNIGAQDFAAKSQVTLTRTGSDPTPGNESMNPLQAVFALPPGKSFADVRPDLSGARFVVDAVDHTRKVDVSLPAGTFTGAGSVGWQLAGSGKSWTYRDLTGTPVNGVLKAVISNESKPTAPNRVKIKITAAGGAYPVLAGEEPIQVSVTLGGPADAAAGLCGDSLFRVSDCAFNHAGTTLSCKR